MGARKVMEKEEKYKGEDEENSQKWKRVKGRSKKIKRRETIMEKKYTNSITQGILDLVKKL